MKKMLLLWFSAVSITGCASSGGPLVFVVTHTVGVDIQAASSSTATPGLTVGYKSVDLAVVPTQMDKSGGHALRGCYAVGQNGAKIPAPCEGSSGDGDQDRISSDKASHIEDSRDPIRTTKFRPERDFGRYPSVSLIPVVAAPPPQRAAPPQQGKESDAFAESVVDAYSVYASFGTGTKAGSSGASVDIGEVFATGDAAVQLAEGVNYYSSRAGNAAILNAAASCAQQVTAAKNAGVDTSKMPDCNTGGGSSQANPQPTLASISPNSAMGPAAGGAAATVSVTLTGTGFSASSTVDVSGNASVTASNLKASADGKSLTADLTIAPGAPKTVANISVTNPAPGGGSSAAQSFTVQ